MKLQFVLGRASEDKLKFLFDQVLARSEKEVGNDFLFVLPGQATLEAQKELIGRSKDHVIMNIDILSFNRLAFRVFEELNIKMPVVLDETGKLMLLRKVIYEHGKEYHVFQNFVGKKGFTEKMKSIISEFTQYQIGEEELKKAEAQIEDDYFLKEKLHDIRLTEEAFVKAMEGTYITSENILTEFAKVAKKSEWLKNCVLILDGYASFTVIQMQLLKELMMICKEVIVTCDLPKECIGKKMEEHELFYTGRKLYEDVSELAYQNNILPEKPVVVSGEMYNRIKSSEIEFLEKHYEQDSKRYQEEGKDIRLVRSKNPEAEVKELCGQVLSMAKNGYRFRDMAAIVGNISDYKDLITRDFKEAGIPYFLDENRSAAKNLAVETIKAMLEMFEKSYSFETVFRFLKIGFLSEDTKSLYQMENYCLAYGKNSKKKFFSEWKKPDGYLSEKDFNDMLFYRNENFQFVKELGDRITGKTKVSDKIEALKEWMEKEEFSRITEEKVEELKEKGELEKSSEYEQILEKIDDIFEQVASLIGEEEMGVREFREILESGFDNISIGIIPPTLDCFIIGDLKRTRLREIKVLFAIGMNDGVFPSIPTQDGLVNDTERERLLMDAKISLAPTVRQTSFAEKYHLYRALTTPSEKLILSVPMLSREGKSLRPSFVINQMRRIFPKMRIEDAEEAKIYNETQGLSVIASYFHKNRYSENETILVDGKELPVAEIIAYYQAKENQKSNMELMRKGASIHYDKDSQKIDNAKEVFVPDGVTNISSLEQFASCEMAHFLSRGLDLKPRKEYELEKNEFGTLVHEALERLFQKMIDGKVDYEKLDEAVFDQMVKEAAQEAFEHAGSDVLNSSEKYEYVKHRTEESLTLNANLLTEQIKAGKYRPEAAELGFGMGEKGKKANPCIELENTDLKLRGKIDRVDMVKDGEKEAVKIVDYKTGNTKYSFKDVYYGLKLQLFIYLDTVEKLNGGNLLEGGAHYYHINYPTVEITDDDLSAVSDGTKEETEAKMKALIRSLQEKDMKLDGVTNIDEENLKLIEPAVLPDSKSKYIKGVGYAKTKKTFNNGNTAVDGKRLKSICELAQKKASELAEKMLSGSVETNPYVMGNKDSCAYCKYRGICNFDMTIPGYQYRNLASITPDDVLKTDSAKSEQKENGPLKKEENKENILGKADKKEGQGK